MAPSIAMGRVCASCRLWLRTRKGFSTGKLAATMPGSCVSPSCSSYRMNNHRLCTEISTETNHRNVSGEGIGHRLSMTNGLSYPECQVFGRLAFCVPVTDLSDVDDLLPTDVHDKASTVGFLVYRFDRDRKSTRLNSSH